MENHFPISKRLNLKSEKLITEDFPQKSRVALVYVLVDLSKKYYLTNKDDILLEIMRLGRFTSADLNNGYENSNFTNKASFLIKKLEWHQVLSLIERIYEKFLSEMHGFNEEVITPIEIVREYFSKEIQSILDEDNLGYEFRNGKFTRKLKYQTQKIIRQSNKVLDNPELVRVRIHYKKSLDFFNQMPFPDFKNCVKEAICALEACVEILFSEDASKDFKKAIRKIQGNDYGQIPPPIVESMIKLHSYRGSGQGVAHAAPTGNKVNISEAELVLSLVAAYITYLDDICIRDTEIPF